MRRRIARRLRWLAARLDPPGFAYGAGTKLSSTAKLTTYTDTGGTP